MELGTTILPFRTTLCRHPAHELVFPTNYFPASPLLLFPSHLGTEQNQPRLHNCRLDYLHGDKKCRVWRMGYLRETQADINMMKRDY